MQLEIVLVFPRCMLQLIVMSPCISLICKVDEKQQSLNRPKSDFNMLFMARTPDIPSSTLKAIYLQSLLSPAQNGAAFFGSRKTLPSQSAFPNLKHSRREGRGGQTVSNKLILFSHSLAYFSTFWQPDLFCIKSTQTTQLSPVTKNLRLKLLFWSHRRRLGFFPT